MRRWMDRGRGRVSEAGAGGLAEGNPAGAVGSPGSVKTTSTLLPELAGNACLACLKAPPVTVTAAATSSPLWPPSNRLPADGTRGNSGIWRWQEWTSPRNTTDPTKQTLAVALAQCVECCVGQDGFYEGASCPGGLLSLAWHGWLGCGRRQAGR
ncbi:hypothetical protein E2C01_099547 [Portunus trituberculatus]|uniref:Uncharacterized protein n=1 Tax=Portunus trituberculatus TaxID=210409 RepID=A0A5B7KFN0_PORTR|nr:hypothetical protein [Portunus trituberculatus]